MAELTKKSSNFLLFSQECKIHLFIGPPLSLSECNLQNVEMVWGRGAEKEKKKKHQPIFILQEGICGPSINVFCTLVDIVKNQIIS